MPFFGSSVSILDRPSSHVVYLGVLEPGWFNSFGPNSPFATRNSKFDAISSPGTPGTPWRLDTPSKSVRRSFQIEQESAGKGGQERAIFCLPRQWRQNNIQAL